MKEFAALTALIIEPHSGMRSSLHNMLNQCEITKIDHAASSGAAIRQLKNKSFDLIICEYDLGEGQDGQQLLEDLRNNKIITLSTVYFIVTAERSFQKVISAAELAPTDYILKPFTAVTLLERIQRAVEKRTLFLPAYTMMGQGNLREAVEACVVAQAAHPRHAVEFARLRAELHVMLGESAQAEPLYKELFETRSVAWAQLGLAKTLFLQNRFEEAQVLLSTLVAENVKFLDAYDWLAKTHEALGQLDQAQEMLQNAVALSPHAVRRLRKLGDIALETGDIATAEKSFQQVVSKARYSEFRDPEDHVRLIKTLVTKGDTAHAALILRDLEKSLGGTAKMPACRALSAALIHAQSGDTARAAEQLANAVVASREGVGLSNATKMTLATSCLQNNLEEHASEVMIDVMSNATDTLSMEKAVNVFAQAGRQDLADNIAKESRRQVIELVSAGAEKAKNGDYRGAVALMTEAARKLPDNPQVVFNAAVAVLKCLENLGWDTKLGYLSRAYIDSARRLDPTNPRLTALMNLYKAILKKYKIAPLSDTIKLPNS